jgi:hypothetical protein
MEDMPSQNMPVQRVKVPILQLDLPRCGLVTRSGEVIAAGRPHKMKPEGLSEMKHTQRLPKN